MLGENFSNNDLDLLNFNENASLEFDPKLICTFYLVVQLQGSRVY